MDYILKKSQINNLISKYVVKLRIMQTITILYTIFAIFSTKTIISYLIANFVTSNKIVLIFQVYIAICLLYSICFLLLSITNIYVRFLNHIHDKDFSYTYGTINRKYFDKEPKLDIELNNNIETHSIFLIDYINLKNTDNVFVIKYGDEEKIIKLDK